MKLSDPILPVAGYTEKATDWLVTDALAAAGFTNIRPRECIQNFGHDNELLPSDFTVYQPRIWLGYSWGVESSRVLSDNWNELNVDVAIIVAGVNGPAGGPDWKRPFYTDKFYCFQVTPEVAFPVSEPIHKAPWVDITDPDLWKIIADNPTLNINCNSLVPKPKWFDWIGSQKAKNHGAIQNHRTVLDSIVRIVRMELE